MSEVKDVLLDLYAADVEDSANVGRQVFRSHMTNEQAAKDSYARGRRPQWAYTP